VNSPSPLNNLQLDLPPLPAQRMASLWLMLGVASLLLAGIFSVLLVLSRTPAIQEVIPFIDFFHVSLVVHVDLSVLIWFMSFAGVLWSLIGTGKHLIWDKLAIGFAVLGTTIIVVAPFMGIGNPLMNNYIPILDHPIFIAGLAIFTLGPIVLALKTVITTTPNLKANTGSDVLKVAIYLGALVFLFSIFALGVSYFDIPKDWTGHAYYEVLFWGGGHVLQFTHTILMLVAWVWIANVTGASINISPKLGVAMFALVVAPVIATPWIYYQYDVISSEHRLAFTDFMKLGGLASLPLGLIAVIGFLRSSKSPADKRPVKAALFTSMALFATGGVIGFLIEGVNVVIPAHYHGSIVGVTLAFMGLTYHLFPKLGYGTPDTKTAHIQPYVYGGGQLMHILGLAWSGGYGVQRKTAGAAQGLDRLPEVAGMAMMGLGGLISIIGGLLFLIVAIKCFKNEKRD